MILGIAHRDPVAKGVGRRDDAAELELKIEPSTRRRDGLLRLALDRRLREDLSPGPAHSGPRDDDAGGASVVAHGQMRVVRLQGIIWPSKHAAYVKRVMVTRVEVGVVSDLHREVELDGFSGDDDPRDPVIVLAQEGLVRRVPGGQDVLQPAPRLLVDGAAQRREGVERRLGEDVAVLGDEVEDAVELGMAGELFHVQHVASHSDADVGVGGGRRADDAEGEVGEGEVAGWVDVQPGRERFILLRHCMVSRA